MKAQQPNTRLHNLRSPSLSIVFVFFIQFVVETVMKHSSLWSEKDRCLLGVCVTLTIAPWHLCSLFSPLHPYHFFFFLIYLYISAAHCICCRTMWSKKKKKTKKKKKVKGGRFRVDYFLIQFKQNVKMKGIENKSTILIYEPNSQS